MVWRSIVIGVDTDCFQTFSGMQSVEASYMLSYQSSLTQILTKLTATSEQGVAALIKAKNLKSSPKALLPFSSLERKNRY